MIPKNSPRVCSGLAIVIALALPGCNTFERLSEVGSGPSLSKIEDPQAKPGYQPVSMPMPTPAPSARNPNSLWRAGARTFLRDQRASQVGDLLTVFITIKDSAEFKAVSARTRGPNAEVVDTANLLQGTGALGKALKSVNVLNDVININSNSASAGTGDTLRHEDMAVQLAVVVTQTLPNGNLVIQGKQQVKVNAEMRELNISGIIRPEDIDSSNQISYEKIAEARISYGGKGYASDVQAPRYGQELLDIFLPF